MKRQKWMMMGVSAVVCAALFAPAAAFARDKDDSYVAPSTVFGTAYERKEPPLPTYGPAHFFAPPENENNKK